MAFGQTFDAFYSSLATSCDIDTITEYLQQFEDLGIKELNNAGLDDTKDWIVGKYQDWGYTDIVEDDFTVSGIVTTNVIVTKTGTLYPDTYVIIDGHYDTKNGPGANDNGSGTVILLELARLIKDIPTEYSIQFVHFSAEEIGLEGSEHYVDNIANPNNMDIKVLFNIDQVGGTGGETNNTIVCERDQSPPSTNDMQSDIMTNELVTCTQLYSNLQTVISFAYGSDYVPFMTNGYVVTGFYEYNDSPLTHTINDSISGVDLPYLHEVTKASMGALLHYSVAYQENSIDEHLLGALTIAPNPATDVIQLKTKGMELAEMHVTISDITGAVVKNERISQENHVFELNIESLAHGTYVVQVETEYGTATERFVKE
ncbi:MAG: hypothetical protein Crog4KO_32270 [Crocinitomicaceae bacterium]